MFNIGGGELVVIAVLALIVLGPQRLPDVARQIGKTMGDLRRVSAGFQREFQTAIDEVDPAAKDVVKQAMIRKVPGAVSPLGRGLSSAVAAVNAQGKAATASEEPPAAEAPAPASPRKKAPAKRAAASKAPAKKAPAKKTSPATKAPAKETAAKKSPAKKAPAKKAATTGRKAR
ncbi:MAG: Sec-independent protein translocase protein TatB [Actinomycetota bacterium]|nr:Sec-independent protein translocase protein TatB [Actinomycetota bacterium]